MIGAGKPEWALLLQLRTSSLERRLGCQGGWGLQESGQGWSDCQLLLRLGSGGLGGSQGGRMVGVMGLGEG